jgi:hypothetical protein
LGAAGRCERKKGAVRDASRGKCRGAWGTAGVVLFGPGIERGGTDSHPE